MIVALLQDVRYALRALRGSPGFAAVAILSLALGIGANTAIFSLINSVILKTLPVAHPEDLLQVTMGKSAYFTNPIWEQVRDRQDVFSGIFAYGGGRFNLAAGGEARFARGTYVSGQFFNTLGLHALIGRTFSIADDKRGCPGTAVLSSSFWRREFEGRADVVGKKTHSTIIPSKLRACSSRVLRAWTSAPRAMSTFRFAPRRSFVGNSARWTTAVAGGSE